MSRLFLLLVFGHVLFLDSCFIDNGDYCGDRSYRYTYSLDSLLFDLEIGDKVYFEEKAGSNKIDTLLFEVSRDTFYKKTTLIPYDECIDLIQFFELTYTSSQGISITILQPADEREMQLRFQFTNRKGNKGLLYEGDFSSDTLSIYKEGALLLDPNFGLKYLKLDSTYSLRLL